MQCPTYTNCATCTADEYCAFCDASNKCMAQVDFTVPGMCPDGGRTSIANCDYLQDECLAHTTCVDCVADERCVFCDRLGQADICTAGVDNDGQTCSAVFSSAIQAHDSCPSVIALKDDQARCPLYTTCGDCANDDGCVWCRDSCLALAGLAVPHQCPPRANSTEVELTITKANAAMCVDCNDSTRGTCSACLLVDGCVWAGDVCQPQMYLDAAANATVIDNALQCPDAEAFCAEHETCGACLEQRSKNCLWCKPLLGDPHCTTGQEGLGLKCPHFSDRKTDHCSDCAEVLDTCTPAGRAALAAALVALAAWTAC